MAKKVKKISDLPEKIENEGKMGGGETKSKNADRIKRAYQIFREIEALVEEYGSIHDELSSQEAARVGGFVAAVYSPNIDVTFGVVTGSPVVTVGLIEEIKRKLDRRVNLQHSPLSFLGL